MSVVHTWKLPEAVIDLATSPDGRRIVTGCVDGCVRVYDCVAPPYEQLCSTDTCEPIAALAVCAGDECDFWVVTVHDRWMVRCWRMDVAARQLQLQWVGDGATEGREKGEWCKTTAVRISHNRQWVAVAGENADGVDFCNTDHDICLFPLRTIDGDALLLRRPIRVFARHESTLCSLCFSPDDRFLVSGGDDHTLRVWSVESGEQLECLSVGSTIMSMAVQRRNKRLVTGHWNGSLQSYPLTFVDSRYVIGVDNEWCISHGSPLIALYCADDDMYAITGGGFRDKSVRIWNLETGALVRTLAGHRSAIYGVGVTSIGDIVSCSSDSTVKLWRLDDPDLTPVDTLLEEEQRMVQFALDCVTTATPEEEQPPLAVLVMAGIVLEDTRLQRRIRDALLEDCTQ